MASFPVAEATSGRVSVLRGQAHGTFSDLHDDGTVRSFIAQSVINAGCLRVEEIHAITVNGPHLTAFGICHVAEDTHDGALLAYCRQRATTVFASTRNERVGEVSR